MEPDFDPAAASGESAYRAPQLFRLNEVLINGDADVNEIEPGKFERKGGYLRKRVLIGTPRDQKPAEINLGQSARLIFLKIRRKLVERGEKGKIVLSTNEHNTANEVVDMYGEKDFIEAGSAKALRERYTGLRTVQIVYALLLESPTSEPELVRVMIRGASLGSEVKDAGATDFFKYVKSFSSTEHFWEWVTQISVLLEKGQKSYYCMNFSRAEKLDDKFIAMAIEAMKKVHFNCVEVDNAKSVRRSVDSNQRPKHEEDVVADEPTNDPAPPADNHLENVNPDDIPF